MAALGPAACLEGEEIDESELLAEEGDAGEPLTPAEDQTLASPLDEVPVGLACSQNNDCQEACDCVGGTCVPDGFGPPPEGYYCDQPPQRACSSSASCQVGCVCSGGFCQPNGFSPPNPDCHISPPDSYETDNTWQQWKAYTGSPQQHNLHSTTDEDWVAVYFGYAGTYRFETTGLSWGTDTVLEVYKYVNGKGPLAGANDDIGGAWWVPDSKGSRVTLAVPANSSYLIRVDNKSAASMYTDSYEYPRYTLQIVQQ
ncbi:MAG: hypothetical protein HC927_11415 [Deltaproteobacteria bacterium]|nr:hypothetical protein [Deltaproteobacteria bacterium]